MTDSTKAAIKAINKWIFYGWNFKTISYEWKSLGNTTKRDNVPQFLAEVKWTCGFDHIYRKWCETSRTGDTDSYLVKLYAELDTENRERLLEWILENYNGETKI